MTQSLYRKYRPQTFGDVVGQQHIVSTFSNAIADGKISHAYLFTGPRGTGKTTTARLLAKSLLCESGPGVVPDGTCEQCIAVARGTHPDVYELDAASRTGVDNVREEIVNRVDFAPSLGRYKVYIIDEVHMLTTAAFNALLKTLEEPPEHVVFILCTTDPQKVPDTIHSRCQRFDFHRISTEDIIGRLKYICEQEGFDFEVPALDMIAKHARGGLRDALTALEQLSVFGNGSITLASASEVLGESASSTLSETAYLIAARDVSGLFDKVATLVENGGDPTRFLHDLSSHIRNVYVVACVGVKEGVTEASGNELIELNNEAVAFSGTDRLVRIMSIMAEATDTMRFSTDQRLTLELAFARMARPEGDLTVDSLAERVEALELKLAVLKKNGPATATPVGVPVVAPAPSAVSVSPQAPAVAAPEKVTVAPAQAQAPLVPVAQPVSRTADTDIPATVEGSGDFDRATMDRLWQAVVSRVGGVKASYGALLRASRAQIDSEGKFWVILPPNSKFAVRALSRPDVVAVLGQQVTEVFGQTYKVEYKEEQGSPELVPARDFAASVPAVTPAASQRSDQNVSSGQQMPQSRQNTTSSNAPEYDGPPLDTYDDYIPAKEPLSISPQSPVDSKVDQAAYTPAPKPVKVFDKKDEDLKITRPEGKKVDPGNPVASMLIDAFGEDTVITEINSK